MKASAVKQLQNSASFTLARVLFTDLGDQKSSHARTCSTTKGVAHLESCKKATKSEKVWQAIESGVCNLAKVLIGTLQAITGLCLLANDIQN